MSLVVLLESLKVQCPAGRTVGATYSGDKALVSSPERGLIAFA